VSNFVDIALPLAERGFRVFPLIPKQKRPLPMAGDCDHFDAATTDAGQIRAWSGQEPNANVGISPDEIFCFLETDSEHDLKEACNDLPPEVWDTARVSARDNRCYYIFRQTMRTKRAGNMTATREGKDNLFEFKQHRVLVTGPGSIHPKTNAPYVVEWRPIPAMPDVLLNRLCELYGAPKATGSDVMSADVKRETALLDSFLERYEVASNGDWFNKGKSWYRPIECPWLSEHENDNQGTSTCAVFTEGSGYGFDCKHRCAGKGWKDFRAELESRFPDRKFSFVNAETVGDVVIGPVVEKERISPVYPIEVWDGTAVGEFAKLCAHDNNIPRKLYAESFRTVLGAVVGDRLMCPVDGAVPRSYTVILAPFGKGKGTCIRRAVRFFSQSWNGLMLSPGLLSGCRDFIWKPQGIGAWNASASSVPGLAKLAKDLEETVKSKPHLAWGNTLPRILSVYEEMKTFFSTIYIEGGVGVGMDGVVCQLWDDVEFNGTATGTRDALYGQMMFSILGGVTPDDWFDLISRGNAVGGGLMSRLNLIGTEGNYANVPKMTAPDYRPLQESLLPRIKMLADAPVTVGTDEGAERVIANWADTLPEGSERMNVQVWRSALLLAWLRREERITAKIASDAVRLGEYQAASQEFYRVQAADNPAAKVQAKILRVLEMKGSMSRRELQRQTNANRTGTSLWNVALEGLVKELKVGQQDGKYFAAE
jgi:hypothetical protein